MRRIGTLVVVATVMLGSVLLADCGGEADPATTMAPTSSTVASPTTTAAPSTTTQAPATTVAEEEPGFVVERDLVFATYNGFTSERGPHELTLDLYIPADPIGAPIVIGTDSPLTEELAEAGAIVAGGGGGEGIGDPPDADDQGVRFLSYNGAQIRAEAEMCASMIRFARARASELGSDDPVVVFAGFSQGGGIHAHVALFGAALEERWDEFAASVGGPPRQVEGVVTEGSTHVDALISTAGAYDLYVPAIEGKYGRTYQQSFDPALQEFLASAVGVNPELVVRLFHGTGDPAAPMALSTDFEAALSAAGYDVQLTTFEGGHIPAPTDISLEVFKEALGL